MWVVNRRDKPNDKALVTDDETLSRFDADANYVITEVVPASDLRASEELVQRLAERYEIAMCDLPNALRANMDEIGLRKVNGKWERVK